MKILYVVRHAKSSWDDPLLDDFSRPLNDRGKRDAPRMAKRLQEKKIKVDLLLSSPARRALATAKRMAEVFNYAADDVRTNPELYHASPNKTLDILKEIKDKHTVVMIFGHNPGLTEFVNKLMNQNFENIPTCGVVACKLSINSWKEIAWRKGSLILYDYPKA
jgi:phosphohistidine phosphatase